MARRIILINDADEVMLSEVDARDEAQLQHRLLNSPDLFPVDEFELQGPLLVVGRETTLPSGSVDLIALARTGDVLVIEMKTGPQNPDFRAALAQATDYGADLWRMTLEVFEATVALRYFASDHCAPGFRNTTSLAYAAKTAWPTMTDEELAAFQDRLASVLASGNFNFVIVAQRFTEPMITTVNYLNEMNAGRAKFFLVELVRFTGGSFTAFEARALVPTWKKTYGFHPLAAFADHGPEGSGEPPRPFPCRNGRSRSWRRCRSGSASRPRPARRRLAAGMGGADHPQRPGRIGGQHGNQPGDHRVGRDRAEQLRLGAQRGHVRQAVPAQGEHHRQVPDDLPRVMHRPRRPPPGQPRREALAQSGHPQRLGQQQPARLGHQAPAVGGHGHLRVAAGSMHLESAFRSGADRSLCKSYPPRSKALFSCKKIKNGSPQAKARG